MFDEVGALRDSGQLPILAGLLRAFISEGFRTNSTPILISSFFHPAYLIQDESVSDYSLCLHEALESFTAIETRDLACTALPAELHGRASELYTLVGGDPYLLQLGIDHLLAGGSLDIQTLLSSCAEYRNHFAFLGHLFDPEVLAQLPHRGLDALEARQVERFVLNGLVSRDDDGTLQWSGTLVEAVFTGRIPFFGKT